MHNAVVFAKNDIVTIAWSWERRRDGCMGFALYRADAAGNDTVPGHAIFNDQTIQLSQTSEQFSVQKFYCKDPYTRPAGPKTRGKPVEMAFRTKIVPQEGLPLKLVPMKLPPILTTNEVELTPICSLSLFAVFNRRIISTRHVANALKGYVDPNSFSGTNVRLLSVPTSFPSRGGFGS